VPPDSAGGATSFRHDGVGVQRVDSGDVLGNDAGQLSRPRLAS
jgi:hypothetical protein